MSEQKVSFPKREAYESGLTDARWESLVGSIPPARAKNGVESTDLREVIDTIPYQDRAGCQWDMLPHDLRAKSSESRVRIAALGLLPRRLTK